MIGIGQIIGNYKIVAKLGSGGMGIVYLAEHPLIGKRVALKVIHRELSSNHEVVTRFFNEARAVNAIGNAHIVEIVDFGQTQNGEFFLVMEHLQGEGLETLLRRGPLDPGTALHITGQIANALEATHAAGYIHRDIKPDNIYLTQRGQDRFFVKLLDFGLVKHMTSGGAALTQQGVILGTPTYMSPEQCESKQVDYRGDIYALGILLFEMLAGRAPFLGQSAGDIMVQQVTTQPPPLQQFNPRVTPAIEAIVLRCVAKRPTDRFQSMGELRAALRDPESYARSAPPVPVAPRAASAGPPPPIQAAQPSYGVPNPGTAGPAQKTMFLDSSAPSPGSAPAAPPPAPANPDAHFIQGQGAATPAQRTMFLDGPPVIPGVNAPAAPGGQNPGSPQASPSNSGLPRIPGSPSAGLSPLGIQASPSVQQMQRDAGGAFGQQGFGGAPGMPQGFGGAPGMPGASPSRQELGQGPGKPGMIHVSSPLQSQVVGGSTFDEFPPKKRKMLPIVVAIAVLGGGGIAAIALTGKKSSSKEKVTVDAGAVVSNERVRITVSSRPEGADIVNVETAVLAGKTNGIALLPKGAKCKLALRLEGYQEAPLEVDCSQNQELPLVKLIRVGATEPDPDVDAGAVAVDAAATKPDAATAAAAKPDAAVAKATDTTGTKSTGTTGTKATGTTGTKTTGTSGSKTSGTKATGTKTTTTTGTKTTGKTGKKKKNDDLIVPSFD